MIDFNKHWDARGNFIGTAEDMEEMLKVIAQTAKRQAFNLKRMEDNARTTASMTRNNEDGKVATRFQAHRLRYLRIVGMLPD